MIGILTALREERVAVREAFKMHSGGTLQGMELEQGDGVVHLCTGMGAERMVSGVEALCKIWSPEHLLLVGFSVGLKQELKVGDLVVDERSAEHLVQEVLVADSKVSVGRVSTCDFLSTSAHKKAFAEHHPDSLMADLETEAFLSAVPENTSRLVIRAVSDELTTDLPLDFSKLVRPDGFPDQKGIGLRIALNPFLLPKLLRLARDASKATKSLANLLRKVELPC